VLEQAEDEIPDRRETEKGRGEEGSAGIFGKTSWAHEQEERSEMFYKSAERKILKSEHEGGRLGETVVLELIFRSR